VDVDLAPSCGCPGKLTPIFWTDRRPPAGDVGVTSPKDVGERGLALRLAGWFDAGMNDNHRSRAPTDEDLLEDLRRLLAARGKLSSSLIEASEITRAPNTYIRRFGSLVAAYRRIGYDVSERQRATSERFRTRGQTRTPNK